MVTLSKSDTNCATAEARGSGWINKVVDRLKVRSEDSTGHPAVSTASVFLVDCAKLRGSGRLFSKHSSSNGNDFLFAVLGILEKSWTPRVTAYRSTRDENCRRCKLTRKVVEQVIALEGSVQDVTRELHNLFVGMSSFEIAHKEGMRTGNGDLILQCLENGFFHVDDLQ